MADTNGPIAFGNEGYPYRIGLVGGRTIRMETERDESKRATRLVLAEYGAGDSGGDDGVRRVSGRSFQQRRRHGRMWSVSGRAIPRRGAADGMQAVRGRQVPSRSREPGRMRGVRRGQVHGHQRSHGVLVVSARSFEHGCVVGSDVVQGMWARVVPGDSRGEHGV